MQELTPHVHPTPRAGNAEDGNAIVVVLIFLLLLTLVAAGILTFVRARSGASGERLHMAQAAQRTDAAVGIKLNEINEFKDESISGTFADGAEYAVVVRVHPQGDILRLTAATRFPGEAP
ncbi:MAG: hypothetical protein ACYTFT_05420, partial [Planctomycetota bacterium]